MLTESNELVKHQTGAPDLYESFIAGTAGTYDKTKVFPQGLQADQITSATQIVLKPDGDFFAADYPSIGPGTKKGDRQATKTCLLRYLLKWFPRAEIRASGGTDASFHVILYLDGSASELLAADREGFMVLLNELRLMAFCDRLGTDLLSALTARAIGSVNSKTGKTVSLVQPSSGTYSADELQGMTSRWLAASGSELLRSWHGIEGDGARCPFHDSTDQDLKIRAQGEDAGVYCFGTDHCAGGKTCARIPLIARGKGDKPSIAGHILAGRKEYQAKWISAFEEAQAAATDDCDAAAAEAAGKRLISINSQTTSDDLLKELKAAMHADDRVYCDGLERPVTTRLNAANGMIEPRLRDTSIKFIALMSEVARVRVKSAKGWKHGPLPHDFRRLNQVSQTDFCYG